MTRREVVDALAMAFSGAVITNDDHCVTINGASAGSYLTDEAQQMLWDAGFESCILKTQTGRRTHYMKEVLRGQW